jgi:hypothetical protein
MCHSFADQLASEEKMRGAFSIDIKRNLR